MVYKSRRQRGEIRMIDTTTGTWLSISGAALIAIFLLWLFRLPPFTNEMFGERTR